MKKFFDSLKFRKIMNKILLMFAFYLVAAISFNCFFGQWHFRDNAQRFSFAMMYDKTATRPFVHRQLMISAARKIAKHLPQKTHIKFIDNYRNSDWNFISATYGAKIEPRFSAEYHIVYFMCIFFLMASMFIWREIGFELTGNLTAGTIMAVCFALIFPFFETVGGYFYDFGELLFFSLATLFAIRGWWIALIILSPIAESNKESFLFFIITLFPLLLAKFSLKKSLLITLSSTFLCGINYLYIKSRFADNPGLPTEFHLPTRLQMISDGWTSWSIKYGTFFGDGMYLPHIILVLFIAFSAWKFLPLHWKRHIKLALMINIPLYILFCWPGELRNLSMLYIGFIAMLAIFIDKLISKKES